VAVLFNNAGNGAKGTALDGLDNWKKVIDVNLWGYVFRLRLPPSPTPLSSACPRVLTSDTPRSVIYVQQTFGPLMIHQENPSVIINTGSKQGITNPPYVAARVT
jgi:NAD(P)-dependent dehydrogenase (short-subunit alcohol dehydrogenase family)